MVNVIKTFLQCFLLVFHLNGIRAIIWSFDISKLKGSYATTDLYVGITSDNRSMSMIKADEEKEKLLEILEKHEVGFEFDEKEIHKLNLWPQGIVPYYIDTVSYEEDFRDNLRHALKEVSTLSGLYFKELLNPPEDDNYRFVYFTNRVRILCTGGFTNKQFTHKGVQEVKLGYNTFSNGDLYSFVLAVAGIPPQSNAPDRDEFVTVKEENILPDKVHLFEALKDSDWLYHDLPYDFYSASHFGSIQYTKSGFPTTQAKFEVPPAKIQGFTFYDIQKIRMTYDVLSGKDFELNPTELKPILTTTTNLSDEIESYEIKFGNPDDNKSKHEDRLDDENTVYLENKKRHRSKSKHKLAKAKKIMFRPQRDRHNEDFGISIREKKGKLDQKQKKKGKVVKTLFKPLKKPNKYLGIPRHSKHEDKKKKENEMKSEDISEDIDVYFSDTSEETVESIRRIKRAKVKHIMRSTKGVNINI